jgi:hypothetical protein
MIEGDGDRFGRYGQRLTALPWPDWCLITFGQYTIDGRPNTARSTLEASVVDVAANDAPDAVAARFGLPTFEAADVRAWTEGTREMSDDLAAHYRGRGAELRSLYDSLHAASYRPEGFAEFVCWYHHIAYAHAIDRLTERGRVSIPPDRFVVALWQEARSTGAF